jgi:uncharacterized surface protein with fasciclin (FAS1) repeats
MKLSKSVLVVTIASVFVLALGAFAPTSAQAKSKPVCDNSIVDIALAVNAESGEFSTLVAAVVAADLVAPLDKCGKNMTVFAPTDAAFAKLGLNADNIGTAFDKKTLAGILQYHIAIREFFSGDVVAKESIRMWKGGKVGVDVTDAGVFLTSQNDPAQIVGLDIDASNGVIHIIDTVLLP